MRFGREREREGKRVGNDEGDGRWVFFFSLVQSSPSLSRIQFFKKVFLSCGLPDPPRTVEQII